jgi:hypothetical protein
MRYGEINLFEDIKQKVLRSLSKLSDDDPTFAKIYKDIVVGTPLQSRIENFIMARKDNDAIANIQYLLKQIPNLTNDIDELKPFLAKLKNARRDFVDVKKLVPPGGMSEPKPLSDVVIDPLAKKLFTDISSDLIGAKLKKGEKGVSDAGPGEGALAILSPRISFAPDEDGEETGGDIRIKGAGKTEVKGYNGVLRGSPVDQSGIVNFLNTQKGKWQLNTKGQTIRVNDLATAKGTKSSGGFTFTEDFDSAGFIKTVTQSWFGTSNSAVENSIHTPNFILEWYKASFDFYAAQSGHAGILFLSKNSGTYCYCVNGEQVLSVARRSDVKQDSGSILNTKSKQNPRELGIRIGLL